MAESNHKSDCIMILESVELAYCRQSQSVSYCRLGGACIVYRIIRQDATEEQPRVECSDVSSLFLSNKTPFGELMFV